MIESVSTLIAARRPLTDKDRRALRAKAGRLTANQRRASSTYLPIGGGIIFLLWLWTILASDAPWLVVTAFWLVANERGNPVEMLSEKRGDKAVPVRTFRRRSSRR